MQWAKFQSKRKSIVKAKIRSVEIIKSSGYKVLDEAAIKWFRELSFKPAHDGNSVIDSVVSQTITFDLNENDMG